MRLRYFGGFSLDGDGQGVPRGRGQEALLLRLALDAGTTVTYRALAEDVWPDDPPADPRASLQSLASRLRRALPAGMLEAVPGGYRLALTRGDVDLTRFQDLVGAARTASDGTAADLAREALALWAGDPWTPGAGFDWVVRDLWEDRAHAERIARDAAVAVPPAIAPDIPAPITALVGRSDELDAIARQLAGERLVTLVGPGGAGKTTLALETARRHPASVVFVELAPAAPGEVWAAVAGAVGRSIRLSDPSLQPAGARERALTALAGRPVVLVLDNCEHVSMEAADAAVDLLHASADARVLATSREPLGVPGEAFVPLGPLPDADAVELFARRVRAARGEAPGTGDEAVVRRIVRRLDGLPLALELAAAKTRTLTLAEIDEGLDDRFALLSSGPRAAEPRHRTLRALIDWSWETLTPDERTALLTAAVFPDGIGAADAPLVARAAGIPRDAFDALVDRSLLQRVDRRFRMLETVREYGLDRLTADGELDRFRTLEAATTADLAATHDALLRGPEVRRALEWFDANEENVSAALRLCEADDSAGLGVRLVRASMWAWMMRERFEELQAGIQGFGPAVDDIDSEPGVVVGAIARLFAEFADAAGRETSVDPERRALLARDRDVVVAAAERHPSELSAAVRPLFDAILAALDRAEPAQPWSRGFVLSDDGLDDAPAWTRAFIATMRSAIAQNTGDAKTLGRESEKAVRLFTEIGDAWGIAFSSQMRSEWLLLEGRLDEALQVADASTAGLAGLTSLSDSLQQRAQSVGLLLRLERFDEARDRVAAIREHAARDGSARVMAQARMAAATLAIAEGDGQRAIDDLGAMDLANVGGIPEQIIAWECSKRAQALVLLGRTADARDALRRAIAPGRRSGDQPILADVALSLAVWLHATGKDAEAHRALAAAAALRGGADEADPVLRRLRETLPSAPEGRPEDPVAALEVLIGLLGPADEPSHALRM